MRAAFAAPMANAAMAKSTSFIEPEQARAQKRKQAADREDTADSLRASQVSCRLLSGQEAAALAPAIWAHLDARRRRMLFWDVPPERREALLSQHLGMADVAGLALVDGVPAGLSWVLRQGDSGLIHMTYWKDGDSAREIGRLFLDQLAERGYRSLLAVLPVPFRHIRRYVADIGFRRIGILPGGAPLAAARSSAFTSSDGGSCFGRVPKKYTPSLSPCLPCKASKLAPPQERRSSAFPARGTGASSDGPPSPPACENAPASKGPLRHGRVTDAELWIWEPTGGCTAQTT